MSYSLASIGNATLEEKGGGNRDEDASNAKDFPQRPFIFTVKSTPFRCNARKLGEAFASRRLQ